MEEPAKALLPVLQRASELQNHEPLVSYYCRLYAMEKGLKIPPPERTKETNNLLLSLMTQLEKEKKNLKIGPDDSLYLEGFAQKVFAKADKQDRAGRADMATAKTFYAAGIFLEILRQFGDLDPELEQKQRYAVWKAADIRKALSEGRQPSPGPPGEDDEGPQQTAQEAQQADLGQAPTAVTHATYPPDTRTAQLGPQAPHPPSSQYAPSPPSAKTIPPQGDASSDSFGLPTPPSNQPRTSPAVLGQQPDGSVPIDSFGLPMTPSSFSRASSFRSAPSTFRASPPPPAVTSAHPPPPSQPQFPHSPPRQTAYPTNFQFPTAAPTQPGPSSQPPHSYPHHVQHDRAPSAPAGSSIPFGQPYPYPHQSPTPHQTPTAPPPSTPSLLVPRPQSVTPPPLQHAATPGASSATSAEFGSSTAFGSPQGVSAIPPGVMASAQKAARLAVSSLSFDDAPAAIEYLRKALAILENKT